MSIGQRYEFQQRRARFESMLVKAKMGFERVCTDRSPAEQTKLYAQGRTLPGRIVTNATARQSAHCWGCATDYIAVVDGKRTYHPGPGWWAEFGRLARSAGLRWGGTFRRLVDSPHVELPGWEAPD